MRNKINAVLKMGAPHNNLEVNSFIGAVTLLKLTGTGQFVWGIEQSKAFATITSIIATNAMNYYPDLNKLFNIYIDASDCQLGAVII